jgi:MFS family permease
MPLSRNIPIAALRSFFAMFMLAIPVLVPYWRSLGLSMRETLELQALFGLSVVLLEVPTGYIADIFGRKVSVVIGGFIAGCAFSYLPFATTYFTLVIFEVTIALAFTLVSGAEDAILYESLPVGGDRRRILGSFKFWSLAGETCSALLAGVLVVYSFETVLWTQAFTGWIPFICALFLVEPPRPKMRENTHRERLLAVVRQVFINDPLTRLVFINYVIWALSSFCVVWLQQEYWLQLGVPLSYFGAIWAGLVMTSAIFSRLAHLVEHLLGAACTLAFIALAPVIGYICMGYGSPSVGLAAGLLFYFTRAMTYVVYQDAFNWRIPSTYRATANSLQSLCFRLVFVPIAPIIGQVTDAKGLSTVFTGLAIAFTVCGVVFLIPLIKRLEELHVEEIPVVGVG